MKKLKNLFMAMLAMLVMVLPSSVASAQTVDAQAGGTGTITIRNASQSQTYTVYKLFEATVTADGTGISTRFRLEKHFQQIIHILQLTVKAMLLQNQMQMSQHQNLQHGQIDLEKKLKVLQQLTIL